MLAGESQMGPSIVKSFYRLIALFCGECFSPNGEIVPTDPISGCTASSRRQLEYVSRPAHRSSGHHWVLM